MKIKTGFVLEKVADSYLACATGKLAKSFNGFIRLNESGAFLWKLLAEKDMSEADLVLALMNEYDIPEDVALRDTKAFIQSITNSGVLEA